MSEIKDLAVAYDANIVTSLEQQIKKLKIDNEHLARRVAELSVVKGASTEELICVEQIQILQNRSSQRELSLEEVKKLDYLIKNLRLIKEQSTENLSSPVSRDVTEAYLVAIASQPES